MLSTLSAENALSRILSGIFLEQCRTRRVLRARFTVHHPSLILNNLFYNLVSEQIGKADAGLLSEKELKVLFS